MIVRTPGDVLRTQVGKTVHTKIKWDNLKAPHLGLRLGGLPRVRSDLVIESGVYPSQLL